MGLVGNAGLPLHTADCVSTVGLVTMLWSFLAVEAASAQPARNVMCGLARPVCRLHSSSIIRSEQVTTRTGPLMPGRLTAVSQASTQKSDSSHCLHASRASQEWNAMWKDQGKEKPHPAAAASSAGHAKAGAKAGAPVEASLIAGCTDAGRCHLQCDGKGVSGVWLLSTASPPSSVQVEDWTEGARDCCSLTGTGCGPLLFRHMWSAGHRGSGGHSCRFHLLAGRADNALLLLRLVVAAGAAAALPDDALAHAV